MVDRMRDEGWLLNTWSALFQTLKLVSIFAAIRASIALVLRAFGVRLQAKWDSPLVDLWVVVNLLLAVGLAIVAASYASWSVIATVFAVYGCYRVAEMLIVQINVLIFDPYRENREFLSGKRPFPYFLRGRYRSLVLFAHNYIEVAFWLCAGSICLFRETAAGTVAQGAVSTVLAKSVTTLATLSGDPVLPGNGVMWTTLGVAQQLVGALFTLVLLARFVSLLPVPPSLDELRDGETSKLSEGQ